MAFAPYAGDILDRGDTYEVMDMGLAGQGMLNIEWAEQEMGALTKIGERVAAEKPLFGLRIGMALHVTKETAVLVKVLKSAGADVAITGCNPLSTQDDVASALAKSGVRVWAYKGETREDYYRYIGNVISFRPQITIDDGCDLVSEIHRNHPGLISDIIGGCEETTTGIIRLRSMKRDNALKYPVVAVNDNKTKHLLDNYYGTGQSTLDGILRATNILFAGKHVVVAGYGSCGKGLAKNARGLGAIVIVTEVDNFSALQARMDGFLVMPMNDAAPLGDVFITVTGNKHVIRTGHMALMKDGAILANSGHFDLEIDVAGLAKSASGKRKIRPFMDEYILKGKRIYLLGEGRLINLAAAEGHPSSVMSTSFCGQALACEYLAKNRGRLAADVIELPPGIDNEIAALQLEAMGIKIDRLTAEQEAYLKGWQEGT